MSYILDALKKSEKERSLGNVPTLGSAGQYQDYKVSVRWVLLLLILLLVVLLIVGGWLVWNSRQQTDAPTAVEEKSKPVVKNVSEEAQVPRAAAPPETAADVHKEVSSNSSEPVPVLDLDPAVRGRLPDLSVNVLSYSDDNSRRFVMIDQNIFKEGEEVKKGVVIAEIRKSDVVFSFEGIRFTLKP